MFCVYFVCICVCVYTVVWSLVIKELLCPWVKLLKSAVMLKSCGSLRWEPDSYFSFIQKRLSPDSHLKHLMRSALVVRLIITLAFKLSLRSVESKEKLLNMITMVQFCFSELLPVWSYSKELASMSVCFGLFAFFCLLKWWVLHYSFSQLHLCISDNRIKVNFA